MFCFLEMSFQGGRSRGIDSYRLKFFRALEMEIEDINIRNVAGIA